MKPHYVTFEQAKLFKELGFDEPCNRFYNNNGDISDVLEPEDIKYFSNKKADVQQTFACMAPEHWQVIEWASLVHNIDIEARPVRYAGDIKTSYYQPYINGCSVNMSKFTTRQEALSEAINEFLKMI